MEHGGGVLGARRGGEPHDRLTRLCDVMHTALEAAPEFTDSVRGVIMLNDGPKRGFVVFGYGDGEDVTGEMLLHLRAAFEVEGSALVVVPMGNIQN